MNAKARSLLAAFETVPSGGLVVEIGCIRFSEEVESDGWSTVYLARAALEHDWDFHSVDIEPMAVRNARAVCGDLGLPVKVYCRRGSEWLAELDVPIDGLYLDGSASATEALKQYHAATLADRCVIVIDDVQKINTRRRGKGDVLIDVLEADGFDVTTHNTVVGYEMAVARRSEATHGSEHHA